MLSGMNDERLKLGGALLHRSHDRSNLHEVWPRPDNVDYLEHGMKAISFMSFVLCAMNFVP